MMKKLTLIIVIVTVVSASFAQESKKNVPGRKKPSLLGLAINLTDFNGFKSLNNNAEIKDKSVGISAYYWKGLSKYVDLSVRANLIFNDYSTSFRNPVVSAEKGIEFEPAINIRPLQDKSVLSPFLTTGIGIGMYSSKSAGYIPVGGGLQLNADNKIYFLLQAQYRLSLTKSVIDNNTFYSFGFGVKVSGDDGAKAALPVAPVTTAVTDADSDGIPDETDACPNEKGLAAFNGCPDSDGDGLADKEDKCPNEKGLSKYNGCPIPDTDKDGINDEEDKCRDAAGLARYQGCPIPDTDNDGINDEEDKCRDVAGVASNMGCPAIDVAIIEKINKAAASIFFAQGSNRLLPKSITALNNVVAILKANPDYKIEINGYMDSYGNADKNKALSEARANAVSDYLVKKGIDASRLSPTGFGDENPIADNKTAAGRAKNRRIEMRVSNY